MISFILFYNFAKQLINQYLLMKKLLLFSLTIVFQSYFAQISFEPNTNHNMQPYTATIVGSGTIYYTTDGTDPTTSSPSGINQVNITITQNTLIKAKTGNSQIFTRNYYYGELPTKVMYFKPPSDWNPNNVCSYMNYVQPEIIIDNFGPGDKMTAVCEGWYKSSFGFYKAWVSFNNCHLGPPPLHQSFDILTEDTVFYDYSAGPISNPPACLLAVNDPSKKIAVVKIFPNPVQDYINIESDRDFFAYEIIDESGRLVLNKDFKGNKIDISNLKTGLYFIKLKSSGNETNIVKFIKK